MLDNLNTHDPASLYKAFPPAEAARIWSRAGTALHTDARELAEHG